MEEIALEDLEHIRYQIEYDGTFGDFITVLTDDMAHILGELRSEIHSYYYFNESYSKQFENHIQLDLLMYSEYQGNSIDDVFTKHTTKAFYQQEDINEGWWAKGKWEKEFLIDGHGQMANHATEFLFALKNGADVHKPREMVSRRFHLMANQFGLGYKDELKLMLSKAFYLSVLLLFGKKIYRFLFRKN